MATKTIITLFLSLTLSLLSASTTSAISASQALNLHGGYSITAASLSSLSSLYNATGTLLAPPDSSLSLLRRRPSPLSLLLSHTFPSLSSSPTLNIIHPNIYTDADFTVHGIDRVLLIRSNPTVEIKSRLLHRTARVLRRKGFGVASIGLSVRKTDLLRLDGVTLFVTSDKLLFSGENRFKYDFLCHVVPKRHRLDEIRRMKTVETMDRTKTITTVGLKEDGFTEIYHNRWIVVIGVGSDSLRFDDVAGFSGGVYGEEDYSSCEVSERGSDDVARSEALVTEKVVESAPSHEVNAEPLDGRVLEESTVEMVRRKVRELSGVGRNREAQNIVPFQVADDLFYYT